MFVDSPELAYVNEPLTYQVKLAEDMAQNGRLGEAAAIYGSHERLAHILRWFDAGLFTSAQLNQVLSDWWALCETSYGAGARKLVRLFTLAGFVSDDPLAKRPESDLVVYRGAGVGGERGFSWSTDQAMAMWFATRIAKTKRPAIVVTATIPPARVLGILNGRDESEVIVNLLGFPSRRIQILEEISPIERFARAGLDS
jgi:hypothetical protein